MWRGYEMSYIECTASLKMQIVGHTTKTSAFAIGYQNLEVLLMMLRMLLRCSSPMSPLLASNSSISADSGAKSIPSKLRWKISLKAPKLTGLNLVVVVVVVEELKGLVVLFLSYSGV
uniref:Uncharacterized protein n=1 Tax=Cannabis sativa TaxID=3483 RepID=A0A803QVG9_CANSA